MTDISTSLIGACSPPLIMYNVRSPRDDTALRHGLLSTVLAASYLPPGAEWFPRPATSSRQVRAGTSGQLRASSALLPAPGAPMVVWRRPGPEQTIQPTPSSTILRSPPPAWHQPPRARTKMTDCLEARIRRSTRTGGQAARTGVEAPVRAATGKDVNAHLEWSGVCGPGPGMVAAWRLQPGGGRCNDNTGRTLIRIHPHY